MPPTAPATTSTKPSPTPAVMVCPTQWIGPVVNNMTRTANPSTLDLDVPLSMKGWNSPADQTTEHPWHHTLCPGKCADPAGVSNYNSSLVMLPVKPKFPPSIGLQSGFRQSNGLRALVHPSRATYFLLWSILGLNSQRNLILSIWETSCHGLTHTTSLFPYILSNGIYVCLKFSSLFYFNFIKGIIRIILGIFPQYQNKVLYVLGKFL